MNTIKIQDLTKTYGKSRGVDNINLDITKGTIYGFIGPNGAGKSTTIRCIMNLINKNSGNIFVNNIEANKTNYQIKEDIGYLPSEIHLYEDLTVKKMLEYSASFYKKNCTERINELVEKLNVDSNKKIDELSLGNLKKVGIIIALMHNPKIVIMDEATSGLDPLMQEVFYQILLEEKEKGTTIFFSSHALNEVKRICDKVAIIKEGKIIKIGNVEELSDTNFVKVIIKCNKISTLIKEFDKENIIEQKDNELKLIYRDNINQLIQMLTKYKVDKLIIEEPTLEEIFIHYYE